MSHSQASGQFDVTLRPEPLSAVAETSGMNRMSLDKSYHGDLAAVSKGEMLAFRSAIDGSAGYVAMETVTGTLRGRAGAFVLQHSATMIRGTPAQSIVVVPDSGTGDLSGLSGSLKITITEGQHAYTFEYMLPESAENAS
ncbi:DUF3224 domain-containing protein [Methylovirgula sp. 4M-Z18]|uniref:DUF3224 domain-containing protein n=1 Tax=Methylovirgula sp. 4M-Z18 TaxID=2293567 RepID=UPI000E2F6BA5|nr:DUF3224 domain-containing protein [Methylovirgula sp. 4M-Z18]RFB78010.1 DUF3224 domain-containing protein [Methylovirgula sp. 4M-Z18]